MCSRVRAMNADKFTIGFALAKYLDAASAFKCQIQDKEQVSEQVVRDCAYWAMMALYSYGNEENWTADGCPRVALPPYFTRDIAYNLQLVLTGHIPQWMLHLQRQGAPQTHPRMAECIGLAVVYKKLAEAGEIKDSKSTKTISEAYGVSPRCVQGWVKEYSWVNASYFFPSAINEAERRSLIMASLQKAGAAYRDWGRGPANQRPHGKAKRRPSAKS